MQQSSLGNNRDNKITISAYLCDIGVEFGKAAK